MLVTFSNDNTDVSTGVVLRGVDYLSKHETSDISAITILHCCFLGSSDDEDGCTKASISISGKKPANFVDFLSVHKANQLTLLIDQNSISASDAPSKACEASLSNLLLLYINKPTQDIDRESLCELIKEFIYASNMGESQKAKTLPYLALFKHNTGIDLLLEELTSASAKASAESAAPTACFSEEPEPTLDYAVIDPLVLLVGGAAAAIDVPDQ